MHEQTDYELGRFLAENGQFISPASSAEIQRGYQAFLNERMTPKTYSAKRLIYLVVEIKHQVVANG